MSNKHYFLKASCECDGTIQIEVADILSQQWPAIKRSKRFENLQTSASNYVLLKRLEYNEQTDNEANTVEVIGHAEIKSAVKQNNQDTIGSGNADRTESTDREKSAIIVSVIIGPLHRGRGLGRVLVNLIEEKCIELGYFNVYLWTEDVREFYSKLGYTASSPVLMNVPAFKQVDANALENLFMTRLQKNPSSLTSRYNVKDTCEFESTVRSVPTDTAVGTNPSYQLSDIPDTSYITLTPSITNPAAAASTTTIIHSKLSAVWMVKRLVD